MDFTWVPVAFICPNPADVPHGSIIAFHVELIFETDRQTVQGSHCLPIFLNIIIELLCPFKGLIKENLMKAIILIQVSVVVRERLEIGCKNTAHHCTYNLMGYSCCFAECLSYLNRCIHFLFD